ncbi:hypothetical protein COV18_02305 [Candidatus Woesearchaeota archaeon CG10_big_fil_rev_8_21_14_0_10_37_12]|nr:MAG: hypothetical protein COV18_02305 [Candidatus Woesearchaeota archaeon CG10_big_fil_rev_8_21_14_0_10_37_12]
MNKTHFLLLILLLVPLVQAIEAKQGSITLLALIDKNGERSAGVASLELEILPGKERVFLETFPMTKLSTQASLRLAQQITCKELEIDCSGYDFLFSINAAPGIVGGPSAGSSAAILVGALLLNKEVPANVAMTGTINSGGAVGPVGGLDIKLEAAQKNNLTKIFLPPGASEFEDNETNQTVNLMDVGKEVNVTVIEAATIFDILKELYGYEQNNTNGNLIINDEYTKIMRDVAYDLCDRTADLLKETGKINDTDLQNITVKAEENLKNGSFYSAASFCFRANTIYKQEWYKINSFSFEELKARAKTVEENANAVKTELKNRDISTMTNLQTFMAVSERIDETLRMIELIKNVENETNERVGNTLGYVEERLFSAITWERFFENKTGNLIITEQKLQDSCIAKLSEAEERYNYVKTSIPEALTDSLEEFERIHNQIKNKEYITCLYGSSKEKSRAELYLNLVGVKKSRLSDLIDLRLELARRGLMKAQSKGVFPIIAYSYYEYAKSLQGFDDITSLLFAEYALDLANLDIYFDEKEKQIEEISKVPAITTLTIILLLLITGFLIQMQRKKKFSKKRK